MDFRFKIQETKRKGRPIDIIVSDFIVSILAIHAD